MQSLIRAFEARADVEAQLIMLDVLPAVSPASVKMLIAAAEEGLLNADKHAQATDAAITVASVRDGMAMTITDNGVGMRRTRHGNGAQPTMRRLNVICYCRRTAADTIHHIERIYRTPSYCQWTIVKRW